MDNWIPDHEEDVGEQTEGRPHPHAVELHQDGHQQEPGGVPLKWELFGENWISCNAKTGEMVGGNFYLVERYFKVGGM